MAGQVKMQVQRHAPIRKQVASILRDAIVDMRLTPGQLLVERQLCEMTDASRPSVREALRQLEAEGLVESQNGRGTFVTVVSAEVAQQVYVVRTELEGLAAQLFAEHATDADRAAFRQAVARVGEIIRGESPTSEDQAISILEAKNEVYDLLFRGAGNPILHQMVAILHRRVNQLRALTLSQPGRPAESIAEIEEILDAIERRDGQAARKAASNHVSRAAQTVFAALQQKDELIASS